MKRVLPLVSLLCMPAMALAESGTKTKEQQVAQEAVNPLTTSYWIPIQYEFSEDVGPMMAPDTPLTSSQLSPLRFLKTGT